MNPDKARELFSEYREGILDGALKTSFETALSANPALKKEYREFDGLLSEFEQSRYVEIEAPFDLHDKIMARIDKNLFEERRNAKTNWFSGRRLGLLSGVAAIAIIGTIVSIKSTGNETSTGDFLSGTNASGLGLSTKDGKLIVKHGASSDSSVLVKDESTGKLVQRFELNGKSLESPQENKGDAAVLLRIESNTDTFLVAIPGRRANVEFEGTGTAKDLAKIAADTYREPVQLGIKDSTVELKWKLDATDPTLSRQVSGKFSFERRFGMLYLAD